LKVLLSSFPCQSLLISKPLPFLYHSFYPVMSGSRFTMSRDRLSELRVSQYLANVTCMQLTLLFLRALLRMKKNTSKYDCCISIWAMGLIIPSLLLLLAQHKSRLR
jgi:serine/threonine protein kinase